MRESEDITAPMEGIFGAKVMITYEMAGSGGDAMPWLFRKAGIGPLVGTRSWGGLAGHYNGPRDWIDGGNVGTPNLAFYNLDGAWDVENRGVTPDFKVEMDPKIVREGHDPSLKRPSRLRWTCSRRIRSIMAGARIILTATKTRNLRARSDRKASAFAS